MTTRLGLGIVGLAALGVAAIIGGWQGMFYLCVYGVATLPGWPLGRTLFGRDHPAGWIAGALLGYGLTSLALWIPVVIGSAWWVPFLAAWGLLSAAVWMLCRRVSEPVIRMPPWVRSATLALTMLLLTVPLLVALPYSHIGQMDEGGSRRYRAYFTADFVWHEALTAELARFTSPPRNPYLAAEPLHYYWAYFVLPATVAGVVGSAEAPIETYLAVNSLCTGILFAAAIFLAAWTAVPRAGPVAAATALTLLASSAEGLYATLDLWRRGRPLLALRALNIDAITSWYFQGLTVDGLTRAIWYNPQHSLACALGLLALVIAAREGARMSIRAAAAAGVSLGLALIMSPFQGGALTLAYAVAVLWDAALRPRLLVRSLLLQFASVFFVTAALLWSVANGTLEGVWGTIALGVSNRAARSPAVILGLALGPLLLPTIAGLMVAAFRRFPLSIRPAIAGAVVALGLFYGVTLVVEPIWIGWRAGYIFLITAPALAAVAIAFTFDHLGRFATAAALTILFAIGLPTTLIDFYNAQDTSNDAMGPGFRWTVVLSPGEQDALRWIATVTPQDALVQMSLGPRGRETWSLIPSFARRRMAAGLPISLLHTPAYDAAAKRADRMYASEDVDEAWRIARDLDLDYVYVGRAEREAFGPAALKFESRPDKFSRAFGNGDAAVYAVL